MTERPLVSIVIPSFNYAHYLAGAIESALGQTYQPVEVIVVDDGSTDDSVAVAQRFPVTLLQQANRGSAVATNAGVRAAHGEFVIRLDADDCLYPRFVERTYAALAADGDVVLAHANGEYFGARHGRIPFEPFDGERLALGAYATCTALIRTSAWVAVGALDERMRLLEDWDFWLALAERGLRGVMIDETLWAYRQHRGSQVRRSLRSWPMMRQEIQLIGRLQDNHPHTFAPARLRRRLAALPRMVARRTLTPRRAALVVGFYGIMLARAAVGQHRPSERAWLGCTFSSTPTTIRRQSAG